LGVALMEATATITVGWLKERLIYAVDYSRKKMEYASVIEYKKTGMCSRQKIKKPIEDNDIYWLDNMQYFHPWNSITEVWNTLEYANEDMELTVPLALVNRILSVTKK